MLDETVRPFSQGFGQETLPTLSLSTRAPVVQKLDSAIHRINDYPVDNPIGFWIMIYSVDSAIQLLSNWGQVYKMGTGDLLLGSNPGMD